MQLPPALEQLIGEIIAAMDQPKPEVATAVRDEVLEQYQALLIKKLSKHLDGTARADFESLIKQPDPDWQKVAAIVSGEVDDRNMIESACIDHLRQTYLGIPSNV
jgi:hypothetical protein